jgi:hypothetical protein
MGADLQNPCRPLVGAAPANYPQAAADLKSQVLYHEKRIGHQLDLVHDYRPAGTTNLTSTDIYFANRAGTTVFIDWKPFNNNWAEAGGGNAAINANIDKMAASVKSVPKKIFLTLNHEPENDVSSGAAGCSTYKGTSGTPAQYVAMWHNVENRFRALGVTNVEWSLDFINYPTWDCMIDQLYPGNDYVNWVWFNAYYGSPSTSFNANVSRFQNLLTKYNSANHAWLSKPWGIVEWSATQGAESSEIAYFNEAAQSIRANTFPKLRGFMVYDSNDFGDQNARSFRVGYDNSNNWDQTKQKAYNSVVNAILSRNDAGTTSTPAPTPAPAPKPAPPPPPAPTPQPPTSGSGTTTPGSTGSGSAKPIVASTAPVAGTIIPNIPHVYSIKVDGKTIPIKPGGVIDTSLLPNGSHTVTIQGTDAAGAPITEQQNIQVQNKLNAYQKVRNKLYLAFHGNTALVSATLAGGGLAGCGALVLVGLFVLRRLLPSLSIRFLSR